MTDIPEKKPQKPKKEHPDLYKSVIKGSAWVFALRIFTQSASFIRYILLANILGVTNWGLIGIATLMIETLQTFTKSGFEVALIQKKDLTDEHLNTAWTLNIVRAIALYCVLYLAAPLFASFRVPPEKVSLTINVIRVIGLSILINSASNIGKIYFQKNLQFEKRFVLSSLATLFSIAVSVFIAFKYRTVWSLVIGKLTGDSLAAIISYTLHPYRPKLSFNIKKAREMWKFGKWILGSGILGFIMTQGDDIFVWSYLGLAPLGLYRMAYRLSNIPATEITNLINQVTFPAYAKIQNDKKRLKNAYLKVLKKVFYSTFLLAAAIFVFGPLLIMTFLDEQWHVIIPAVKILSLFGFTRAVGGLSGSVLKAVGKTHLILKLMLIKLLFLIILIFPLTYYLQITGTALAVTLAAFLVQPFLINIVSKIIGISIKKVIFLYLKFIFLFLFVTVLPVSLINFFNINSLSGKFIFLFLVFVFCFVFWLFVYDRKEFMKLCEKIYDLKSKLINNKNTHELSFQKDWVTIFKANKDKVREYWHEIRNLDQVVRKCKINENSKIIDIGSGISTVCHFLPGNKTAVDPLMNKYRKLYNYPHDIKLVKASAEKIPFPDQSFDVAFCNNVLDHVSDPLQALNEIYRILKINGYFVFSVEVFPEIIKRTKAHPHCFTKEYVQNLVEKTKFNIEEKKIIPWFGLCKYVESKLVDNKKEYFMILKKYE